MYLHPCIKLGMNEKRKGYPSDVSDEEWSFCVNYLTLMKEEAPQREYTLRQVFNALRYLIRVGGAWRMLPNDLPPWKMVYHGFDPALRLIRVTPETNPQTQRPNKGLNCWSSNTVRPSMDLCCCRGAGSSNAL